MAYMHKKTYVAGSGVNAAEVISIIYIQLQQLRGPKARF